MLDVGEVNQIFSLSVRRVKHHIRPSEPVFCPNLMDSLNTKSNDNIDIIWAYASMCRYLKIVSWIRAYTRGYRSVEDPNDFKVTHMTYRIKVTSILDAYAER
jgi:hypothetical protein